MQAAVAIALSRRRIVGKQKFRLDGFSAVIIEGKLIQSREKGSVRRTEE